MNDLIDLLNYCWNTDTTLIQIHELVAQTNLE